MLGPPNTRWSKEAYSPLLQHVIRVRSRIGLQNLCAPVVSQVFKQRHYVLAGVTLLSRRHDLLTVPLSTLVVLGNGSILAAAALGVNLWPRTGILPDVCRMLSKSVLLVDGARSGRGMVETGSTKVECRYY